MAKRKIAQVKWKIGDVRKGQKLMGDGDGRPIDDWIHQNAQLAGKTDQQWLNDAVNNLHNNGRADWMQNAPAMNNADDVKGFLDGAYSQFGDGASDQIWHMWQDAGAKFDSSWQYQTSKREDTGQKTKEKVWDVSKHSWVDKEVPVMNYVDTRKVPYLVRNDAPVGSIFKATYVDPQGVSHDAYLTVADHGTNGAEMSDYAQQLLHTGGNSNATPNTGITLQYLGQGSTGMPTADSVKADGERLEAAYKKQLEDAKNKKNNKTKGKSADAQTQGGVQFLAQAPAHNVAVGQNKLLIAVAHPQTLHSGGQPVVTGSGTIVAGVDQSPVAGEGDLTKDGFVIKKGTGDQTIEIT